ncbi:MAG: methyltransferase domain-containing protein, partial [Actinomycetota bacterium]|nr:methyltransferase domain-containing protein [Actinomycetota bacterium]
FLGAGHFDPLIDALARTAQRAAAVLDGCLVDVGAGTGEYLVAALERTPGRIGLALDISKHAARRAARASERIGAVVCDAWGRLPLQDSIAAAVLSVFAPRNAAEFARVLQPGGALIVVTPTGRHLAELLGPLGMVRVDPDKQDRIESALSPYFAQQSAVTIEAALSLTRADAVAAARMGPSAHHLARGEAETRAADLEEPMAVTLSATVSVWMVGEAQTQ